MKKTILWSIALLFALASAGQGSQHPNILYKPADAKSDTTHFSRAYISKRTIARPLTASDTLSNNKQIAQPVNRKNIASHPADK
jgi:hypothetical protein